MKLFPVLSCISGLSAFSAFKEEKIEHSCLKECTFGLYRSVLKCYTLAGEGATEEEIKECENQAMMDYWFSCLGEQCGAHLPEGLCLNTCVPLAGNGLAKCDEMLENGEINGPQHLKCLLEQVDIFEECFETCFCDQPYCNCEPPESNPDSRDLIIHCYH